MPTAKPKDDETVTAGFPGDDGYQESDWDSYAEESVYEDSGYKIDWPSLPNGIFLGTYKGTELKTAEGLDGTTRDDVALLLFTDRDGEACCTFSNYALSQAMEKVQPGDRIKITWHGKTDIGNSQTMNRISVAKLVRK